MADVQRQFPDWNAKQWNQQFSINQDAKIHGFWQETKRTIGGESDDELSILLGDFEESGTSCLAEEMRDFCRGESMEDFESEGAIAEGKRQVVWFDERSRSGDVKMHKNLSAVALDRLLKAPVCISILPPKRERMKQKLTIVYLKATRKTNNVSSISFDAI